MLKINLLTFVLFFSYFSFSNSNDCEHVIEKSSNGLTITAKWESDKKYHERRKKIQEQKNSQPSSNSNPYVNKFPVGGGVF